MKIIKPNVKEIGQENGINGIYKVIEVAGRVCYNSLDKITDGSAEKIVKNFEARKHGSPMEFGTVYLQLTDKRDKDNEIVEFYRRDKYSRVNYTNDLDGTTTYYITSNYRVLFENNRLSDLEYLCKPTWYHDKRRFFMITEDRGVMAEFTRHRTMSHCVQSTRYCNYSQDKYGNEITVIKPCFWDEDSECYNIWKNSCTQDEYRYMHMLELGATPEQARSVLPNSLKTIHCMCGYEDDWQHFFELRCSDKAHPQAREVADMIKNIF